MKKFSVFLLCLVLLFGSVPTVLALDLGTTYYIDSETGNDTWDGQSMTTPWKSAAPLSQRLLTAGDKVLFKAGGTYVTEEVYLHAEGTKENPVLISAYGEGQKPLLTTDKNVDILRMVDNSYVTVQGLEFTAHNGGGIWIDTKEKTSVGVTLADLTMHDIQNTTVYSRDSLNGGPAKARACIMVKRINSPSRYPVDDLTIRNCELYDCGNGISLWGSWNESGNAHVKTEEEIDPVYNHNTLIEKCYFHDMDAEAVVVGMCDGALVTDCRCINCCQGEGYNKDGIRSYANAAMWFWGSENSTIQYCEIAGQKNLNDGMACDFDSHTNNCTYQYIYSHDNISFAVLCPKEVGQHNNTIRYCLSVNDNVARNRLANRTYESGLQFYNNTIINAASFQMAGVRDGYIANNIIVGDVTTTFDWITRRKGEDGQFYQDAFTGTFTNNCLYGTGVPTCAKNTKTCNPGFVGGDPYDPNSYKLAADSPLLGKGAPMHLVGVRDFYGNDTGNNIGCYDGAGENTRAKVNLFDRLYRLCNSFLGRIYQPLMELFNRLFAV